MGSSGWSEGVEMAWMWLNPWPSHPSSLCPVSLWVWIQSEAGALHNTGKMNTASLGYIFMVCNSKEWKLSFSQYLCVKSQGDWDSWTIHQGKTPDLAPPLLKTLPEIPTATHTTRQKPLYAYLHGGHTIITFAQIPLSAIFLSSSCTPGKFPYSLFWTHLRPDLPWDALVSDLPKRPSAPRLCTLQPPLQFHPTPLRNWDPCGKQSGLLICLIYQSIGPGLVPY